MTGLLRLLAGLALALVATAAWAETRVALVIANANYAHAGRLASPAADAALMRDTLQKSGFTVQVRQNVGQTDLRRALQEFSAQAAKADVAVVYYAGHGMELDGANYLIPVDAALASDRDVAFEAVPLAMVLQAGRARRLSVVILDACRNNPFASSMAMSGGAKRSVSRGLGRIEPDGDTLVVYAAKDGTTAADGQGNSPFAKALASRMPTPGLEISLMLRQVRDDVMRATSNQQQPFTYGSMGGDPFYFVRAAVPVLSAGSVPTVVPTPPNSQALELALWDQIKGSRNPDDFKAYLGRYPDGAFAGLARQWSSQPYISYQGQTLSPAMADGFGIPGRTGAVIVRVVSGSVAERGGLVVGDVVLEADGVPVQTGQDLTSRFLSHRPGDVVQLQVLRGGQMMKLAVPVGSKDTEPPIVESSAVGDPNAPPSAFQPTIILRWWGFLPVGADARRRFGLPANVEGLVVETRDPEAQGLRRGDVIQMAGGYNVRAPVDLENAIARARQAGRSYLPVLIYRGRLGMAALPLN